MGKIYKRVGGCVSRLTQIGGGGGPGTKIKRRPSASLIYGGDGGGQYISGIKR